MQKMLKYGALILSLASIMNLKSVHAESINSSTQSSENHKTPSESRLSIGTYGLSVHTFEEEPIYYKKPLIEKPWTPEKSLERDEAGLKRKRLGEDIPKKRSE